MPCYGGLSPCPRRMGGGKPRLAVILEGLNRARGTAYDTTESSTVYVDNLALARAIAGAWSTNQRLANQRTPRKMTTMLPRWEAIYGIVPPTGQSDADRREAIAARFARFGVSPTRQTLIDVLTEALGDVFVDVEYLSTTNAVIHVPDGSYPFGTVVDGVSWSSSVAKLLIRTQLPNTMSIGEFLDTVKGVYEVLEPLVPSWVIFDWYLPGPVSVNVSGGPSAGGFYLDDDHNLDFEVFDV